MKDYSSNFAWILGGVLFSLLAVLIGFVSDRASDNSEGRWKAALIGTLLQMAIMFVLGMIGG